MATAKAEGISQSDVLAELARNDTLSTQSVSRAAASQVRRSHFEADQRRKPGPNSQASKRMLASVFSG